MSIQYSSLIGACKRWCSTFPNNKNPDKPTVLHSFGAIGLYQHMNLSGHHENIHRYDFDPLKPHFYIVKLGFTGVYIIFVISSQKHRLCVLVGTASMRIEAVLTSTHNLCFEQKYEKYQNFFI